VFIHILFHVCLCVIVLSLRSDSDYNKEATYLLTYISNNLLQLKAMVNNVGCQSRSAKTHVSGSKVKHCGLIRQRPQPNILG